MRSVHTIQNIFLINLSRINVNGRGSITVYTSISIQHSLVYRLITKVSSWSWNTWWKTRDLSTPYNFLADINASKFQILLISKQSSKPFIQLVLNLNWGHNAIKAWGLHPSTTESSLFDSISILWKKLSGLQKVVGWQFF